jgi:hypothetical protein
MLAVVGGAGCGSSTYLQLTYRSTDMMLGTTDTTTLDGSSVERKSVQVLCNLEFSNADVDELVTAFEAVPSGSVPADASPGTTCTACTRFDLDAKLTRADSPDLQINSHWLIQPSESVVNSAFIAFVAKLNDMQMRAQTQGTCVAPPL